MKHNSFIILITLLVSTSHAYICDRTPKKAENPKPNTDRYVIEVAGTPDSRNYSPGQTYIVVLKSNPQNPITNAFTQFTLVVEPEAPLETLHNVLTGELRPKDHSIATFTPKCPSAIIQTNNLAKSNVEVFWTAPPLGNGCVAIKATVYESSDSWYSDDGGLTKVLCEEGENKDDQGDAFEQCCACDEAKYEVAFQGMWTRNTHPTDYPPNMWTTKLGEIIGASHKYSKAFWNYASSASEGLKLLAEKGETDLLENELKELVKSDDIRTIIKARELSYPNITGISYTVFRVDQDHHLISLVSKITPSPDWIVGVANLELCTPDCKWIESRTLNLHPWDIGTDSGKSYNSADDPTSPADIVKKITSDLEDYPFHNPENEAVKPIAQLRITRQKLYEKFCDTTEDTNQAQDDDACKLSEWSEWSSCSSTCKNEVRTRDRQFLKPENQEECTKEGPLELQDTASCPPTSVECESTECSNATWSDWSMCDTTCGIGHKTRNGRPVSAINEEENKETEGPGSCEETVECFMPQCEEETTTAENIEGLSIASQVVLTEGPSYRPVVNCEVSPWSEWGSCSGGPCERGYQYKERHIVTHPSNGGKACPRRLRREKHCKVPCHGEAGEEKPRKHKSSRLRSSSETVDCQMSPWTEWTPCSSNCGSSAVQIRTRTVEIQAKGDGRQCGPRLEERKCSLPYACTDREWVFLNRP